MPFAIDQNICVSCGSCIVICPNRAIVRRGAEVIITDMCCDCGTCIRYCAVKAISPGAEKADFDNAGIDKALKKKLGLTRDIVAMKYADKAPEGFTPEEGVNFWCHICGDIFDKTGGPVFFAGENSICGGGAALGLGARMVSREDVMMVMDAVSGMGGYFATHDLFTKARADFPKFSQIYKGLLIASLAQLAMPDVILLPVNAHQMCMLSTAYSFETGEVIQGTAGGGTCLGTVVQPFLENKPVFTCGDHGGRMHMRLRDDENLVCFPFRLVPGLLKNMDRTIYATDMA